MRTQLTTPLGELIEHQAGVISLGQLLAHGLSRSGVKRRVASGALVPLHRAVFAVGHRVLTPRGRWWAAVLACGDGTLLSHRSASSVLDFWGTSRALIDVITPRRVRLAGIDAHRHRLHPDDRSEADGLPVTTPERTLVDLADVLSPRQLAHAYERAQINRLVDARRLDAVLERAVGRRGAPALAAIVRADRPAALTGNEFERALLELVRAAGLPEPEVNYWVHGLQADFCWPSLRLIVETDGGHHERPARSRADKRRDALLLADGWRTLRFSFDDVTRDPAFVVGVLRPLLA